MECTIASSPGWSCLVSTRAEGSNDVPYSPQLTSKDEVDVWIGRAQAALLCPHLSRDTFKIMDADQIKDTTGAGDAFAGGLCAGLLEAKSPDQSIDMGQWLARLSIQELGPSYVSSPCERSAYRIPHY